MKRSTKVPEIYRETIEYMNDRYPFMVTNVILMGRAVTSEEYPLARVVLEEKASTGPYEIGKDGKTRKRAVTQDTMFLINQTNMMRLNHEENTFVLLKETMHVMLNHRKMQFPDMKRAEIAAEIVINDYLVQYGLPMFEGILYGPDVIGRDSYGLTVREVYDMLPPNPEDQMGGTDLSDLVKEQLDKKAEEPQGGEDGSGSGDPAAGSKKIQDGTPSDIEAAGADGDAPGSKLAGQGQTDLVRWSQERGVELAWADLLKPLMPKMFNKHKVQKRKLSFQRLNRKTAFLFPEVVLPVYVPSGEPGKQEDGKKPTLVLAIDTSGSVSRETVNRFFRIASTLPVDEVECRFLSFTSGVQEFTLDNPRYASGGTAFGPIEKWIQQNYDEYPSAVFVFTDGAASFYGGNPENIDKWHWFLCDHHGHQYLPPDVIRDSAMVEDIERFVR
jgi:hypothetical protein